LTLEAGIHFVPFTSEYTAVVDRAQEVIASLPPRLHVLAEPLLPEVVGSDFSRIVALLPYWVGNLLDGLGPATCDPRLSPKGETEIVGLANLFGWWSYLIQDQLLDGETDWSELLPLATALHVAAVRLLERLLPGHEAFWDAFQHLSFASAEAHCWEQQNYRLPLGGRIDDLVDLDRLADRSMLLQLAVVAQFALRGYDLDHPLSLALAETLRQYAIARQIGDDLIDWLEDLRRDRLNYVSACTAHRMHECGAIRAYTELDAGQMAGFYLYDDELFTTIQRTALDACQQAAASLAPFESPHLSALVDELRTQLEDSYEMALQSRHKVRALFPPLVP
jgi:hypothetical protein